MTRREPITAEQRAALAKLAAVLGDGFYLVGGVAVSAHLGHRTSRDLDLFATRDPNELRSQLDRVTGITIDGRATGTLHLRVDAIPVSLIEYRYPLIAPMASFVDLPVQVASLDDLACMKLSAIAGRGATRAFWDLHTIITRTARPLREYLDLFRRKYPVEDIGHVIRSLAYFGNAGEPLPAGLSPAEWERIRRDFEGWVRELVDAG